jgi:UDP-N-acetylmuramate--alanine ligase
MDIFPEHIHRIHFVGIKGIAMAALAVWAKEAGYEVTGSDIEEEFPSDEVLHESNISVLVGFQKDHITQTRPELVIYTGAHGGVDNVEVQAAIALSIPVFPHGKALGHIMNTYRQISVAGCHGKTTTTAMIATILSHAHMDPSYAIGCGQVSGLGLPGHRGKGEYFVAEADEYITDPTSDHTPRFLWQHPEVLVITNIDYDHPDAYKDISQVQDAFATLTSQQKGMRLTIMNADDEPSQAVRSRISGNKIISFGVSPASDYRIGHIEFGEEKTIFTLEKEGRQLFEFTLQVPGKHNVMNAAASAVACFLLGLSWKQISEGLRAFKGTKRRFEKVGLVAGATIYDDYAHHPKEIMATLAAGRAWYPDNRLIVVFQPHTYSRTWALMSDFAQAFTDASIVLLADIYASARESDTLGISGMTLVEEASKLHANVHYTPQYADVAAFLHKTIHTGDVVLFIGAGNIYSWSRQFVKENK